MGRKLASIAKRIRDWDGILSFFSRGITILAIWGGLAVSALYGVWAYIISHAPLWALPLIVGSAFIGFLIAVSLSIHLWNIITAERLDEPRVGEELVSLSERMMRWISGQARLNPEPKIEDGANHLEGWELRRRWEQSVSQDFRVEFSRELFAALMVLKKLEIELPFHLSHISPSGIVGLAAFIGSIGQLLKDGRLEAAQGLDDHDGFKLSGLAG